MATNPDSAGRHRRCGVDSDSSFLADVARDVSWSPTVIANTRASPVHTRHTNAPAHEYTFAIADAPPNRCSPRRANFHAYSRGDRGASYGYADQYTCHTGLHAASRLGALHGTPRRHAGPVGLPLSYQCFPVDAGQLSDQPGPLPRSGAVRAIHCHSPHAPPTVRTASQLGAVYRTTRRYALLSGSANAHHGLRDRAS